METEINELSNLLKDVYKSTKLNEKQDQYNQKRSFSAKT